MMSDETLRLIVVSVVGPSVALAVAGIIAYFVTRSATTTRRQERAVAERQRLADRQHDEERQDQLSAAAARSAREIVEANRHTAEVVEESNAAVLDVANKTHDLVNSAMTTQKELTLTFAKATLAGLHRNAAITSPSAEEMTHIAALTANVTEMEQELAERAKQQAALDSDSHAATMLAAASKNPTVVTFAEPQRVIVEKSEPPA